MQTWESKGKENHEIMAKSLLQWAALPLIGLLVGIIGTYAAEFSGVKHQLDVNTVEIKELRRNDDAFMQALTESRRDFTERVVGLANLQEKTIDLSKELIALVKLQQQTKGSQ